MNIAESIAKFEDLWVRRHKYYLEGCIFKKVLGSRFVVFVVALCVVYMCLFTTNAKLG